MKQWGEPEIAVMAALLVGCVGSTIPAVIIALLLTEMGFGGSGWYGAAWVAGWLALSWWIHRRGAKS